MTHERESLQNTASMQEALPIEETPHEGHQMTIGGGSAVGGQPQGREVAHWRRRITLGTAGLLAALGIGFAADRGAPNSNDEDIDRGVAPLVTSTPEPIKTPAVELTPTKEPEKSPYDFSVIKSVGSTTFSIQDKLQTRTECPDPGVSPKYASLVPCGSVEDLVIDRERFPNVDTDIDAAAKMGFYFAWRSQDSSRQNVTFEDYIGMLEKGEDLTFKTWGFKGESFLPSDLTVKPTDKIFVDFISDPVSIFKASTSDGVGYRKINDEFHIELWNYIPPNGKYKDIVSTYPTMGYIVALSYLSFYDKLKDGTFRPQDEGFSLNISKKIGASLYFSNPNKPATTAITFK